MAITIGRWGTSLCVVAGATLLGFVIRDAPFLLPNGFSGLVAYELGPGLILAAGINIAIRWTCGSALPPSLRLFVFLGVAVAIGTVAMLLEAG